ncbi:MAG: hypothetical protein P8176_12260 [Gammaproteobacteria bacterium]
MPSTDCIWLRERYNSHNHEQASYKHSSSQQLLAKQIKALKRAISVQQFECRVAKAKTMINENGSKKQHIYSAMLSLLLSVQKDLKTLKRQCVCSQQLLIYFGNRHHIRHTTLQNRLQHIINDLEKDAIALHQTFRKRHGPTLFRKNGTLNVQGIDEWITTLKNLYLNSHNALNSWHESVSNAFVLAQTNPSSFQRQSNSNSNSNGAVHTGSDA